MSMPRLPVLAGAFLCAAALSSQASVVLDKATSGVDNDGTLVNVSLSSDAKYGSGSLFSPAGATTDGLYIGGDLTDLDQVGDFAAMAWVKGTGTSKGILALGSCCSPRNGYTLNLTSSGTLRFWGGVDENNSNYNALSNSLINDGDWHHVGVRVTAQSVLELLVDGVVEASITYGLSTSPSNAAFPNGHIDSNRPTVGGDGISVPNSASLHIDEVRVYSTYLDDAAWAAAMAGQGTPDQLYYDFEGAAPTPAPAPAAFGLALAGLVLTAATRRRRAC